MSRTKKQTAGGWTSRAYEQRFEMIVHGRLPPGARFAKGPLAETPGVSRTPVREALRRLRQEGLLIEVGGGSGLRGRLAVAPLQRERMEELFALAGAIEALAVRGLGKVEAARREELARRLEGIERAFHPEARRRVPEYDPCSSCTRRFTARGWKRPQARRRARCCARSSRGWMRYEWFYAPMAGPDFTPTRRKHAATVDAVRQGGPQELEHAVRAHRFNAAQRLGPPIEHFDGRLPAGAPIFSISGSLVGTQLAGVWVIAETSRPTDKVRQDRGDRRPGRYGQVARRVECEGGEHRLAPFCVAQ